MKEMTRRIMMTAVGVLVGAVSAGMFQFAVFGMDPFQVLAHGIWNHIPMGYGTLYMIINLLMLIVVFFVDKKKIGIGTMINIFLVGYLVDYSSRFYSFLFPAAGLTERIIFLVVGFVFLCFGSALYFTGDLGVSTYDAVALILSEKTPVKFQYWRIGSDLICTGVGYLLGAVVGVGTLMTAFFMGPLIAFFRHRIAYPLRYGKERAEEIINEEKAKKLTLKKKV
jgi:uncharacterized membrane protein YczE